MIGGVGEWLSRLARFKLTGSPSVRPGADRVGLDRGPMAYLRFRGPQSQREIGGNETRQLGPKVTADPRWMSREFDNKTNTVSKNNMLTFHNGLQ